MALSNYAGLVSAINGWLSRSDMATIAPDLIRLAEAEFNRRLRTIEMEAVATSTIDEGRVALPTDFLGLRSITMANTVLEYVTPSDAMENTAAGTPWSYTIADGQFYFRPTSDGDTVTIAYYQAIPALTEADYENWLLTKHPDLYLFASLAQAEFYNWNDDRLPVLKSRTDELIDQVNGATMMERYGGRRLVAQSGVATVRGVAA